MFETTQHARLRSIRRHVSTDHARSLVGKALYEAIVDGLDFGPRDLPTSGDREWIRGAMAMPIQEATDVALEALAWRMSQILEQAPTSVRDRFDHSHEWQELGWE